MNYTLSKRFAIFLDLEVYLESVRIMTLGNQCLPVERSRKQFYLLPISIHVICPNGATL